MELRNTIGATLAVLLLARAGSAADAARVAEAARRGDEKAVRNLIAQHADVNVPEADGTTALHWAVRRGDAATVGLLIRSGAAVQATNRYRVTPLALAATAGDPAIVDQLLKAGADPNTLMADGQTVLMMAARTGRVDTIKLLVARGAKVEAKENWMGETPLIWATAENNTAAVRALVEMGANVNGRSGSVKYPEQKPADPSNYVSSFVPKGQWTPLMYAARQGATEAALALVELGADINAPDPEGVSPLLEAILNVHFDLAATLLDKGADPNLADAVGLTPLYAAVEMYTPAWERSRPDPKELDNLDCLGMMRVLLDHGANPNAALKNRLLQRYHATGSALMGEGTTPLIRASRYDNLEMVRLLVARGADVKLSQKDGTTALMVAAGVKYALTQEGDPANAGTADDAFEIVKLLAEKGSDVNAENLKGETALYGAAFVGRNRVISYLADDGARLDAKTKQGLTVLDGALNTGVSDDGTGSRVGGKPGEATITLVRELMAKAGVPETDSKGKVPPIVSVARKPAQ